MQRVESQIQGETIVSRLNLAVRSGLKKAAQEHYHHLIKSSVVIL